MSGTSQPRAVQPRAVPPDPTRLKRRAEFLRAAAKGRKAPVPGLVLQALARGDAGPLRVGFTVTKKVGNAVIRNRTRRRLKEAARLVLAAQPVLGADLVLIGRDRTRGRKFAVLQEDLRQALIRAGVATAPGTTAPGATIPEKTISGAAIPALPAAARPPASP